jgi:DNA repair exonuclease SbcCD ATPase subunit
MIIFEKIRFKNFLSFGNQFTEVTLNSNQTTVIVGRNGAGKSTMLDAISFVLYGKPYRSINKPQLVNSVNNKDCVVEIEFSIGSYEYRIIRGIKPNIFEIYENGNLINQESHVTDYQDYLEKNILKINYTAFTQIVVLGKATYVPFMKLKSQDRRNLIEELLGITIFSKMNEILKGRLVNVKNDKQSFDNNIELLNEKLSLKKKYIQQLSVDNDAKKQELENDIELLYDSIEKNNIKLDKLSAIKQDLLDQTIKYEETKNKQRQLEKFEYEFNNKIKKIKKELKFFHSNDECTTCGQHIDETFKIRIVDEHNSKLVELESDAEKLNDQLEKVSTGISFMEEKLKEIRNIELDENLIKSKITESTNLIKKLQLKKDETVLGGDIQNEINSLGELKSQIIKAKEDRSESNTLMSYYQSIGTMLKDTGIKSMIVQKYLPIFNQLINQHLTKFELFVKIELDETFNETILSRSRDNFSYSSFSEGEKLRIDLAILLTWREISKMKNAMSTNLLIMDEVFDSSLDQTGVDAFIDLIPKMEFANIFVISHTPDKLYNKFKNIIEIEKDGNFSVIK